MNAHTRNIVLVGEGGVGKSSAINMISGTQLATTSNNVLGHTSKAACYVVETQLGAKVNLWEAAGLVGETHLSSRRLQDLKTFLRRLLLFHSIDLLIFCMHAGRVKKTFIQSYQAAYIQTCERKVPVALIVTGLEREKGDMHGWWSRNRDNIFHHDLAFDKKINLSRRRLRELIQRSDYVGLPHDHICPGTEILGGHIVHPSEITRDNFVVVLVGPTGSGKSSFISKATNVPEAVVGIGGGLYTCTSEIKAFKYTDTSSGKEIVLVDTPGFSHSSTSSDTTIINAIANWVQAMFKAGVTVAGVLYFYSMLDQYVVRTPQKDLRFFQDLYEERRFPHTIFVTTMWDHGMDEDQCNSSCRWFRETQWQEMIQKGAKHTHFLNTQSSARSTIQLMLEAWDTRTIVVVGADGVGKSSIVNAIAGESLAATSKDTNTCTRDCASYRVKLESGVQITIWDTVGLDGTAETEGKVTALINHLSHFPGIDLLLFCVRGKLKSQFERFKNVLSCVPENVAPVALVVTGLETESDINTWWSNNKDNPKIRDLAADAHACVTTLWPSLENPALLKRIYASQRRLRELVQHPLPVRGFTVEHTSSSSESNIFKSEPSPSLASVSFYDLTQGDAVIILLGPTGSGKSLFISRLAGISEDKAGVGHDLCSHTDRIKVFRFTDTTGIPVVLVDTPGFNNTNLALPDEKICALMHSWLSETYKRDIIVAGILYFHPTGGVTNQFLRPFWSVYGETMYSRLIIVMTMCDDCTGQKGAIEHRTEDLERMLAGGAKTIRYENSEESARTVCRPVLDSLAVVRGLHLRRAVTDLDQELQKLAEGRKASAIRDVDKLSYMEQLADEHLELLRHVREQSKEDIYKLQKRCEEIRRQMNDILAQMKYAETPSTKRIMRCLRTYW